MDAINTESDELAVPADDQVTPVDKPKRMTTGQKVGVSVGVGVGTGLLAWGMYRLGKYLGWWGDSPIVVDDQPADGSSSNGGGSTNGGGESSRDRMRLLGKPPNISKDPAGYNTALFPNPTPVRVVLTRVGYSVPWDGGSLVPDGKANPEVTKFQNDWNRVIEGIDLGRVKLPTAVAESAKLAYFRGRLAADGIPGKNTLNALEIAMVNQESNKVKWYDLVKQARS